VPSPISRGLSSQYATERMRMLATTSPLQLATQVGYQYA
jgi:hypothetical protein